MKTVIEMAKKAGYDEVSETIPSFQQFIERFAALVREDERERQQIGTLTNEGTKKEPVATLADLEQEIYENTRMLVPIEVMEWMLKRYYAAPPTMQQEPVAYAAMLNGEIAWDADYPFSNEPFTCFDDEQAVPLYTIPPTAALAARQMRDAAVKVCRENAEAWGRLNADDEKHGAERCADEIAAMPILGETK